MKKRFLAIFLALGMALTLLAGCGGSKAADGPEKRAEANEITIGLAEDLDESLDPHMSVAAGTRGIMFNVFEGLVKPTPDGDLVPAIASDVHVSDDGLTYTFTLRQGVKFHNGDTVEMEDVLYSIRRNAGDGENDPLIPELAVISDMKAEGDQLIITLSEPNTEFLANMTLAIIPADYDKQATDPVGTGPYKYVSRVVQDNFVLERFEDYWGTPGKVDKVTFKIIEKAESLVQGLQSGALDLVSHMTATQINQLNTADFHVEMGTMNLVQALYLNNAVKPFDDVRVRQALCYAVDKQAILDLAFDGYGSLLGSSMFPAFGKYFDESLTDYYPHDIAKAKELLTEAGYPNGFDMTITVPSIHQPHVDTAQVIAQQLQDIGVNATIQPVEWSSWKADVYSGRQFQSTVIGLDAHTLTARDLLQRFHTPEHGNFINYSNAEYDALYEKAIACADDAEQTQIYRQMERNLTENAANVYIQDLADLVAVRNGLEGPTFYPMYVLDVSSLYWNK